MTMNIEQKELLIKDLCARLPYGVKGVNKAGIVTDPSDWYCGFVRLSKELENRICFSDWKPYLFPLSSMTEEQEKELNKVYSDEAELIAEHLKSDISGNVHTHRFNHHLSLNWYLKNHFDINDLIPMGLAIDATNKNIY